MVFKSSIGNSNPVLPRVFSRPEWKLTGKVSHEWIGPLHVLQKYLSDDDEGDKGFDDDDVVDNDVNGNDNPSSLSTKWPPFAPLMEGILEVAASTLGTETDTEANKTSSKHQKVEHVFEEKGEIVTMLYVCGD